MEQEREELTLSDRERDLWGWSWSQKQFRSVGGEVIKFSVRAQARLDQPLRRSAEGVMPLAANESRRRTLGGMRRMTGQTSGRKAIREACERVPGGD